MAGRKITQLPTLTTPSATDKLVIVDVSDTTESPQGTSKQIALENLGNITSITSTDETISIDNTDPSAPDLSAKKITSLNLAGDTFAEFRSESGVVLYAKFDNANFNNPFTVRNDEGVIKISFFDESKLSTQAAAIADPTDLLSLLTAVPALLAALRAYGLIAE
jgi:hypothetical protein